MYKLSADMVHIFIDTYMCKVFYIKHYFCVVPCRMTPCDTVRIYLNLVVRGRTTQCDMKSMLCVNRPIVIIVLTLEIMPVTLYQQNQSFVTLTNLANLT
jgi:hypothetical protein